MNEHDDCLRRINRLAFENGQLRFYLREAITSMARAEVFISTREKMHQTGQELWHDLLTRMETCLNENERNKILFADIEKTGSPQ